MKFVLSVLVLLFSYITLHVDVYAADSADHLYDINKPQQYELMSSNLSVGTYSTNDYKSGLFDLYMSRIEKHNIPDKWIDNSINSSYPAPGREGWSESITYEISLVKPSDFNGIYFYVPSGNQDYLKTVRFYDSNGLLLKSLDSSINPGNTYHAIDIKKVKKIQVIKPVYSLMSEFELFLDPVSMFESVSDILVTNKTHNSASFTWKNPVDNFFNGNRVYLNDQLLTTVTSKIRAYTLKDLDPSTEYKLTVSAIYNDVEIFKHYDFKTANDPGDIEPPTPIDNLSLVPTLNSVNISFTASKSKDVSYYKIFRNGLLVKDKLIDLTYKDTGLDEYTQYIYKVVAVDKSGNQNYGVSKTVRTLTSKDIVSPSEVSNLKVKEDYTVTSRTTIEQLNALLTYDFPADADFSHLVIYRNGTLLTDDLTANQFLDIRLNQKTNYKYTVHTVDNVGNRSKGLNVYLTTSFIPDAVPPDPPQNLKVLVGNASGRITWDANKEPDIDGYNVYLDGVKVNTKLVKSTSYLFKNLINEQSYDITLTAVDWSGNESIHSAVAVLKPKKNAATLVGLDASYDLKDVADSTANWFSSLWWIVAFVVGIMLAFLFGRRFKELFVGS